MIYKEAFKARATSLRARRYFFTIPAPKCENYKKKAN
jgi:hypothetical protein